MLDKQDVKISWFEWGFLIGIVGLVDLVEFGIELLDLTVVGIIAAFVFSALLDIAVGFGLFMYCFLRGIPLTPARVVALLGGFLLELIPIIGGAPLWTLDVIYLMISVKAEEGKLGPVFGAITGAAAGALVGGPAGAGMGAAAGALSGEAVKRDREGKGGALTKTTSAVTGTLLGSKGGGSKMPSRTTPPPLPGSKTPPPLPTTTSRTTPPPLPGSAKPPPLPRQTPPPLPAESTQSQIAAAQRGAHERVDALREHAADYKQSIKDRTEKYGRGAREGQQYIHNDIGKGNGGS